VREAREQALAARGDLKKELADEIAIVSKKVHMVKDKAPEYQQRYDANKVVLELFGVSVFKLQTLKDEYARKHGGASTKNSEDYANLLDNAVFHIREGKVDSTAFNALGMSDSDIKTIAEKLSGKLKEISDAKAEDRANAAEAYIKSILPEFDADKFRTLNGAEYNAKVHKAGLAIVNSKGKVESAPLLDLGFDEKEIQEISNKVRNHKPSTFVAETTPISQGVASVATPVDVVGDYTKKQSEKAADAGQEVWKL